MRHLIWVTVATFLMVSCNPTPERQQEEQEEIKQIQTKKKVIKNGSYTEFYPSGKLKISGEHRNGKRISVWSAWFENGNRQSEVEYIDDKQHGRYQVWFENGNLRILGEYDKGERIGVWKYYSEDGKLGAERDHSKKD